MAVMQNTSAPEASVESSAKAISRWCLSLSADYKELNDYLGYLSQVRGDLPTALANAHSAAFEGETTSYSSKVMAAMHDKLYRRHDKLRVSVAAIAGISDIVESSCEEFSNAIDSSSDGLSNAPTSAKNDCLSSLSPHVAGSVVLKQKFENGVREPLEESLAIHDSSAARWFYKNRAQSFSSLQTCAVVGLPVGFCANLSRSVAVISSDGSPLENLPLKRGISSLDFIVSARSLTRPYDSISSKSIAKFHPYVHAYVASEIDETLSLSRLLSERMIALMCYDETSGSWIDVSPSECVEFLTNGGSFGVVAYTETASLPSTTDANIMIQCHAIDAILKSTLRVVSGFDFKESVLSSSARRISAAEAASLLQLFSNSSVIPRGAMTASQFLNANNDGTFSPIPYSKLSGEAPDLTTPSEHSLLLKVMGSGIFTSETIAEKILTPDPFERTYCLVYNPSDLKYTSDSDMTTIEQASLFSLSVEAE
jgi:hypothetical protein